MSSFNPDKAVDDTNRLSLNCTHQALLQLQELQREYPAHVALTISVDTLLTAAVAVLKTAALQGFGQDPEGAMRRRVDYILSLPERVHQRQSDGRFGPGQAVN